MTGLILKRASLSRSSGQWSDDDYDVISGDEVVGRDGSKIERDRIICPSGERQ